MRDREYGIVGGALAVLLASAIAASATVPAGPEFPVNSYRANAQRDPDVAILPDGGFVIVWESQGQDGSGNDVFAQRFSAGGAKLGNEFQVSASVTTDMLLLPQVAAAPDGSFAVVWQAEDDGIGELRIYGRWYRPDGSPATAPLTLTTTAGQAYGNPAIDADGLGRFVVVFTNFGETGTIEGRRYSSTGAPLGPVFRANPGSTGGAGYSAVAADANGAFVVTWHEFSGGAFQVRAQRFDATQAPAGSPILVSTNSATSATAPSIDAAPDGRFVIAWEQQETSSFHADVFVRRFAADGTPAGAPFPPATDTAGDQTNPDVGLDASARFVVVWQAFGPPGEGTDVFVRGFSAAGVPTGAEIVASEERGVQQDEAAVAVAPDGSSVVTWQVAHSTAGFDVAARRFRPGPAATAVDFGGNGDSDVSVFRSSEGRWLVDFDFFPGAELDVVYGKDGDVPLPKDWNGDGATDFAVFRPASGMWFLDTDRNGGTNLRLIYGRSGDVPVPGDYDGDGRVDLAVYRQSSGAWFVDTNRNGGTDVRYGLGGGDAVPVPADYDGDGRTDAAVFRPSSGRWSIDTSGDGVPDLSILYGKDGDLPVPADYDGDGRADLAVFRPVGARWFLDTNRNGGSDRIVAYGASTDVPVPGDFDGDGRSDFAVYRPTGSRWFVDVDANGGTDLAISFGVAGDVPLRENGWILDTLGLTFPPH